MLSPTQDCGTKGFIFFQNLLRDEVINFCQTLGITSMVLQFLVCHTMRMEIITALKVSIEEVTADNVCKIVQRNLTSQVFRFESVVSCSYSSASDWFWQNLVLWLWTSYCYIVSYFLLKFWNTWHFSITWTTSQFSGKFLARQSIRWKI